MSQKVEERKTLIAVKIRGTISAQREARETLQFLHLEHTNHAVLLDNRPAYKGMLQRVQAYVTWGEADKSTVKFMVEKRGRLAGDKKLTEEYLHKIGYQNFDELTDAIVSGKVEFAKLQDTVPVFKLHPPSKGYKGKTKKSFRSGGEAGNRGEAINALVQRMV
jgi:large subunit ribosomal protein L30